MQSDVIEAVGIDEGGCLWVKPVAATFQGFDLELSAYTTWSGVDPELRQAMGKP
jgi:hypothetical protein